MTNINFWTNDPTILINKESLLELWPTTNMTSTQKLNAISRLIILLTIIGYFITRSLRIIATCFVTLGVIIFLYNTKYNTKPKKETFKNILDNKILKKLFYSSTPSNPLGNVKLPEIQFDPHRKSAPPAFNPEIEKQINKNTKEMVQKVSFPDDPNVKDKLFHDLADNFLFERSMQRFYTTANTSVVPGDQAAFAEYLYGDMPSCKEGDVLACEKNVLRNPEINV
jgi:hypothetical protein|tara:strand:- start:1673 stop:2347 length:675 start_codon:yes stop_codon:yes gene_type:complete